MVALPGLYKERAWKERWFLGPSLMLFAAVLIGTLSPGIHGDRDKTFHKRFRTGTNEVDMNHSYYAWPHEPVLLMVDDLIVRKFGCFLTVPLVLPHFWALLRHHRGQKEWRELICLVIGFVLIHLIRVVIYLPIKAWGMNEYFSDHVFLVCSLVAAIQMTQGVLVVEGAYDVKNDDCPCHGRFRWAERPYVGLLSFILFVEVIATARTYHTRLASWAAYVTGTVVFTCITWTILFIYTPSWAARVVGDAREGTGSDERLPYRSLPANG